MVTFSNSLFQWVMIVIRIHKVDENADFVLYICTASFVRLLEHVMSCCCFQCQLLGEKSGFKMVSMVECIGTVTSVLIHGALSDSICDRPWCLIAGTNMSHLQQFSLSLVFYFHLSLTDGIMVGFLLPFI